jgi:hypothetical protein
MAMYAEPGNAMTRQVQSPGPGGGSGLDDAAVTAAIRWVEVAGALYKLVQLPASLLEFADALLDLREALVNEVADMLARRTPSVANVENLADLAKGEPGFLGVPDESHAFDESLGVVAISRRRSGRLG